MPLFSAPSVFPGKFPQGWIPARGFEPTDSIAAMRNSQTPWLFTLLFTVVIYLIFAVAGIYVMFWR